MKRLLMLVLPVLLVAVAGCRQSSEAPAPTAAPDAPAAAPPAASPPPAVPANPAASSTPLPGSSATANAAVKPVPAVLPAVVARVNGEELQRWEVESTLKQAEANAGGPVPAEKRDAVIRGIIDELIMYHLLAQEARARNIGVAEAEVDTEMATIRKSFPTEESYQQALLLQGVTADQLRQVTRLGMQARKMIDAEVTTKVAVQDAEVDAFYNQNLERFKQGDTVRVSHIYFEVPQDSTPAQKNQSRAAAQDTLKQLRAGGDFAKLATERSSDQASAGKGGEMGFIEKGQVPPDFEKIAFTLKPGTVSDVVELETGFHILKVHERRGPRTAPLAEVREGLKQYLVDTQQQSRLEQLVEQLKTRTKIEILI